MRPPGSRLLASGTDPLEPHEEDADEYEEPDEQDNPFASRWALKEVTFSVERGERVAIIGRNGSGKSTLLKIIGGLCVPTEGTVSGGGCVVPLNSIVQPFQPTASGLSNIRILCQILKIDLSRLREQIKEMVAFSELGERVHDRVSTYSRGMYARLATAAALHLEPDILLVDGSFSVGDQVFRKKVDSRLRQVVEDGAILLYAGHKLSTLQSYCDRAIWLDAGRVHADGPAEEIFGSYSGLSSAEPETDVVEDVQQDDSTDLPQIGNSNAHEAWMSPPERSAGPKLLRTGRGRQGNLLGFAVHAPGGKQAYFFEHPAELMFTAVVETLAAGVTFDAQLDLWTSKTHAVLARPAAPFRIRAPGRHHITATLDADLLPDNLYTAKIRIAFLDDSGSAQELALSSCDFFVSGKALRDERRRRFESIWPPKRLRGAFLTPDLDWQALPVREGEETKT